MYAKITEIIQKNDVNGLKQYFSEINLGKYSWKQIKEMFLKASACNDDYAAGERYSGTETPLTLALKLANFEVATVLVDQFGEDILEVANGESNKPLMLAMIITDPQKSAAKLEFLKKAKSPQADSSTLFFDALNISDFDVVSGLIEQGNINKTNIENTFRQTNNYAYFNKFYIHSIQQHKSKNTQFLVDVLPKEQSQCLDNASILDGTLALTPVQYIIKNYDPKNHENDIAILKTFAPYVNNFQFIQEMLQSDYVKGMKGKFLSEVIEIFNKAGKKLNLSLLQTSFSVRTFSRPIELAVSLGDMDIINILKMNNVPMNPDQTVYYSPLIQCLSLPESENKKTLEAGLLSLGARYDAVGMTSIAVSEVINGSANMDVLKTILANGGNVNEVAFNYYTKPITLALNANRYDIVEVLFEKGVTLDGNNLSQVRGNTNFNRILKKYLKNNLNPENFQKIDFAMLKNIFQNKIVLTYENGETPILDQLFEMRSHFKIHDEKHPLNQLLTLLVENESDTLTKMTDDMMFIILQFPKEKLEKTLSNMIDHQQYIFVARILLKLQKTFEFSDIVRNTKLYDHASQIAAALQEQYKQNPLDFENRNLIVQSVKEGSYLYRVLEKKRKIERVAARIRGAIQQTQPEQPHFQALKKLAGEIASEDARQQTAMMKVKRQVNPLQSQPQPPSEPPPAYSGMYPTLPQPQYWSQQNGFNHFQQASAPPPSAYSSMRADHLYRSQLINGQLDTLKQESWANISSVIDGVLQDPNLTKDKSVLERMRTAITELAYSGAPSLQVDPTSESFINQVESYMDKISRLERNLSQMNVQM